MTGHVRDPQGRPLPGVSVYVNPEPGAEPFDSAATDRDGLFVLPELPRRPLQINLNRPRFQIQTEALPADRDEVEWTYRLGARRAQTRRQAAPTGRRAGPSRASPAADVRRPDPPGNDLLADGPGGSGNDLNRLPRGIHKLGDAYFRIGERMVHVQGRDGARTTPGRQGDQGPGPRQSAPLPARDPVWSSTPRHDDRGLSGPLRRRVQRADSDRLWPKPRQLVELPGREGGADRGSSRLDRIERHRPT